MSDHSINLTDVTRQPHPDPCPDCGREHMNGEHISLTVPASDGGTRTVWEGCADCWAKRTDPKNVTTEARDAAVAAEWADHFEVCQGTVGPEPLTVESMIAALRGPRPFGREAGESGE